MTVVKHLRLSELGPVDLDTVRTVAHLTRRVDRKYLVPATDAARLVASLADTHRALEIAGRRSTTYCTTYLDTGDLRLCRAHLQGRRLRWKARSRLYVEDGLCSFEVKLKGARGETVKLAVDVEPSTYGGFGSAERAFVAQALGHRPPELAHLRPVLEIGYSRATLVDLREGSRLTIDHGVTARPTATGAPLLRSGAVTLDQDRVIVETKSRQYRGLPDRLLGEMGHRPLPLSKYTTSAALLADGVADNELRRLLGRGVSVHSSPAGSSIHQEVS